MEAPVRPWKVWVDGMPDDTWEYFEDAEDALRFVLPYLEEVPGVWIEVFFQEERKSISDLIDRPRRQDHPLYDPKKTTPEKY